MPKDSKEKAIADAQRAQLAYERDIDAAREARRKSFERAQMAGLSLRDIGDAVGLHRSRVGEILRGE
jgi:DNA-directed RNA polymerase specialized sigma24 family protein